MNDPVALDLYAQLIIFQRDFERAAIHFSGSDDSMQDTLLSLARKVGLEFECCPRPRLIKNTRILPIDHIKADLCCDANLPSLEYSKLPESSYDSSIRPDELTLSDLPSELF